MHKYLLKTYFNILSYSSSKWALYILAIIAFTESFCFIIPPDLLLIPMILSNPNRAFFYAFIAGIFSVLGGLLGYILGYFCYDYIGSHIINLLHYEQKVAFLKEIYARYGFCAIIICGFTPIPYKLITIFSGFIQYNVFSFLLASIVSRFCRFILIAILFYFFGNKAKSIFEKNIGKITLLLVVIIVIMLFGTFVKQY